MTCPCLPVSTLTSQVYSVWNVSAFAALMRHRQVFLNLHKGCGDAHQPLEAFRVAQILSAGVGLILSEPAYPRDAAEYEGWEASTRAAAIPSKGKASGCTTDRGGRHVA